ncbi:MAG: hypothetical protein AUG51_16560 [Acidobacteria bacterium 13_1_20CM_3_53_8]|nr:MAG: hypothetical protein AUG51_16560 [Acidobacteria bacterium 13_1_20CM_3_53_8]
MKPLSPDTTPEEQEKQFELLRRMPIWKRAEQLSNLIQSERALILADLRHRYPQASEEELRRRFIAKILTRDEVISAYGFDPEDYAE